MKMILTLWEKFENFVNNTINRMVDRAAGKVKQIKSKKIFQQKYSEDGAKISLKARAQNYARSITPKIKQQIAQTSKKVSSRVGVAIKTVQSIDHKKMAPKVLSASLLAFLTVQGTKIKYWYLSIRPEVFLGYTIATSIVTISSINIYKVTQTISKENSRSPAQAILEDPDSNSEEKEGAPLPPKNYNSVERRQLTLYEVVIPVLIESEIGIKSLLIDMDIQTSNRFSREILYRHEYLLKDRLNKNLHPIIPEFPLTEEGKRILKDKVKSEVDKLLKDLKIEGNVELISFIYIMAA
jgi:hypothetical protein